MDAQENPRDAYLRQILHIVFKRKQLILSVFLLIFLGVFLAVLMAPRSYEASAILMLKRERGELVLTPNQVAAGNVNPSESIWTKTFVRKPHWSSGVPFSSKWCKPSDLRWSSGEAFLRNRPQTAMERAALPKCSSALSKERLVW